MTIQATAAVSQFDPLAGIWRTIQVPVTRMPDRAAMTRRTRRTGPPSDRASLSNESPFAFGMADTAYAPGEPLADDRRMTHKPATISVPHRAAVVPAGTAASATARTRWHDLGR